MDFGATASQLSLSVLICHSGNIPKRDAYQNWVSIGSDPADLDEQRRVPELAKFLEESFDSCRELWWEIACQLNTDSSAPLAHAPSCAANVSDFGLMLAWTNLIDRWSVESEVTLVVCDDPWMFRHLRTRNVVSSRSAPPLTAIRLKYYVRGYAARLHASINAIKSAIGCRAQLKYARNDKAALLVYGHPASRDDGYDGYFADLLSLYSGVSRVLHVDCPPGRAKELEGAGRTISLHGFGSVWFALKLPFFRWRPSKRHRQGNNRWLVRRAAALEGGGGQGAMIGWQLHCQEQWLARTKPKTLFWPWENHGWERALVGKARSAGIKTIGYQHSVVGRQMLNYSPRSYPFGKDFLPDEIISTGLATKDRLVEMGIDNQRITVGGAWRYNRTSPTTFDRNEPIFVALPFDLNIASEMIDACRPLAKQGVRFLVKEHPMTPHNFVEESGLERTDIPFHEQPRLSAVIYAATTVGIEGALSEIPTIRFMARNRIAMDILPPGVDVPSATKESLRNVLHNITKQTPPSIDAIFPPVDHQIWRQQLVAD